jgi:cytochrome P450
MYFISGYYALFNNMIDLFIAGMETTSSSQMWTFLFFLHHPEVQAKVHQELDEVHKAHSQYPVASF